MVIMPGMMVTKRSGKRSARRNILAKTHKIKEIYMLLLYNFQHIYRCLLTEGQHKSWILRVNRLRRSLSLAGTPFFAQRLTFLAIFYTILTITNERSLNE